MKNGRKTSCSNNLTRSCRSGRKAVFLCNPATQQPRRLSFSFAKTIGRRNQRLGRSWLRKASVTKLRLRSRFRGRGSQSLFAVGRFTEELNPCTWERRSFHSRVEVFLFHSRWGRWFSGIDCLINLETKLKQGQVMRTTVKDVSKPLGSAFPRKKASSRRLIRMLVVIHTDLSLHTRGRRHVT